MREPTFMMFARWDTPPGVGEPAHGFVLKLVREQGIPSLVTFNIWNEVADNLVRHERSLDIIEQHPFPEEWKARVRHATPMTVDGRVVIGGQSLRRIQVTTMRRRWCPACIAEKAYHRVWWEVVCVQRCPYHGLPLECRDAGGGPVLWTWTDFETSRNGYMLARYDVPPYSEVTFTRYMIGRMGFDDPQPHALFDRYHLSDVITFCEMYGKLLSNGWSKRVPELRMEDIDIGFRASDSREALTDHVRAWIRQNSTIDPTLPGHDNVFGYFRGNHHLLKNRELQALSRAICREASSLEYRRITRPTTAADFDAEHTSIRRLARELNMSERGVNFVASELEVIDRARPKGVISFEAADSIRVFVQSLLAPPETRKLLGIPVFGLRKLREAGYLKVFVGLTKGKRNGARFDRERIDAILAKIDGLEITGDPELGVPFATFCRQNKVRTGATAVRVLSGEIKITSKGVGGHGFAGLMLEGPLHVKKARERATPVEYRRVKQPGYLNVREASAILNLSNVTVYGLSERGLLGEPKKTNNESLLPRKAVVSFAKKHARISVFEQVLGTHPTVLNQKMLDASVTPVMAGLRGRQRMEAVYRRKDILKVFGLESDTSMITDEVFQNLWRRLQSHAREMFLTMYFPLSLPLRGQRVWEGSYVISILFRFDQASEELSALVSPKGAERRTFRLPLGISDKDVIAFLKEVKKMSSDAKTRRRAAAK